MLQYILIILLLCCALCVAVDRYVRLSQPQMNDIMLLGCMLFLITTFLHGLDGRVLVSQSAFGRVCQLRAWLMSLGFSLAYGGMFSKVLAVYRLTTHRKKDEVKVRLLYLHRCCIVLCCIVLYCIVLYCVVLCCIVLCCIVLYCVVLYCVVLYCVVLCCVVLCCIVLYCVVLYCVVLCCVVLCCVVLYCVVLFVG
jgi:hypothetical protein